MRDLLNIAGITLILFLSCLVALPYIVNWEAQRSWIEAAFSDVTGAQIRTGGRIRIRILPTPQLYIERLRVDYAEFDKNALSIAADNIETDLTLTALLQGKIEFNNAAIDRLELKLPFWHDNNIFQFSKHYPQKAQLSTSWILSNVKTKQFYITFTDLTDKRIDQLSLDNVQIQANKISGPWNIKGELHSLPFQLNIGDISANADTSFKITTSSQENTSNVIIKGILQNIPLQDNVITSQRIGIMLKGDFKFEGRIEDENTSPFQVISNFLLEGKELSLQGMDIDLGKLYPFSFSGAAKYTLFDYELGLFLEISNNSSHKSVIFSSKEDEYAHVQKSIQQFLNIFVLPFSTTVLSLRNDRITLASEEISDFYTHLKWEKNELQSFLLQGKGNSINDFHVNAEYDKDKWIGYISVASAHQEWKDNLISFIIPDQSVRSIFEALSLKSLKLETPFSLSSQLLSLDGFRLITDKGLFSGTLDIHKKPSEKDHLSLQVLARNISSQNLPALGSIFNFLKLFNMNLSVTAQDFFEDGKTIKGEVSAELISNEREISIKSLKVDQFQETNLFLKGKVSSDGKEEWSGAIQSQNIEYIMRFLRSRWKDELFSILPEWFLKQPVNLRIQNIGEESQISKVNLHGRIGKDQISGNIETTNDGLKSWSLSLKSDQNLEEGADSSFKFPYSLNLTAQKEEKNKNIVILGQGFLDNFVFKILEPIHYNLEKSRISQGKFLLSSENINTILYSENVEDHSKLLPFQSTVSIQDKVENNQDLSLFLEGMLGQEDFRADINIPRKQPAHLTLWVQNFSLSTFVDYLFPSFNAKKEIFSKLTHYIPLIITVNSKNLHIYNHLSFSQASLSTKLSEKGLETIEFKGNLWNGELKGSGSLTRHNGLMAFNTQIFLNNFDIDAIQASSFIKGKASLNLELGAASDRLSGFLSNLGGNGTISFQPLHINSINENIFSILEAHEKYFQDYLTEEKLKQFFEKSFFKGNITTFPKTADLIVSGGVFHIENLDLESNVLNLKVISRLNLVQQTMLINTIFSKKILNNKFWTRPPSFSVIYKSLNNTFFPESNLNNLRNLIAEKVLLIESERIKTMNNNHKQE